MNTNRMTRRRFLGSSSTALGLALGGAVLPSSRVLGANEKFIVGCMGMGGRGTYLARLLAARPDVEVAYVADPDSRRANRAAESIEQTQNKRPQSVTDFRRILDDKAVVALFNATPDHWHALGTILACQAGKDVYVEKPASHSVWEGRKMVEAARKYGRVVQLGTQNRSAPYVKAAADYIQSGKLGDVNLVRVFNMKTRGPMPPAQDAQPPEGVDYDIWLGPAPFRPFNANHFHGGWNWLWDYSGGDIVNDGVHQMDIARWIINKPYPKSVVTTGGKWFFDDAAETPDTQLVHFEYDDMMMTFELTLWTPYMKKIPVEIRDRDIFPDWRFCATKIEIYGSKNLMILGRHGGGWQIFTDEGKVVDEQHGKQMNEEHIQNFFDCVKSRQRPNADIEEGHLSTLLCHLGNISYRVGGRRLQFNGATERFVNDDEANALLKRTYRAPWVVPDNV